MIADRTNRGVRVELVHMDLPPKTWVFPGELGTIIAETDEMWIVAWDVGRTSTVWKDGDVLWFTQP